MKIVGILLVNSVTFDKGPFKYYVIKEVGGWGQKMTILLIYSTIYTDVGGWVGLKKSKNMVT